MHGDARRLERRPRISERRAAGKRPESRADTDGTGSALGTRMTSKRALLSAAVVLMAVACARGPVDPEAPGDVQASALPRELSSAPASDLSQAVDADADFAFDLYKQLAKADENL